MTIGSFTVGNPSTSPTLGTDLYFFKSWSGTDRSPVPPPPKYTVFLGFRDRYISVPRQGPKGIYYEKVKISREVYRWRRGKPPRRASNEEHPYECDRSHYVRPAVYYNYPYNYGRDWTYIQANATDPWTGNDDLKLLEKLRSIILGSDFNPGTFLVEGHQSLSMILNSAARIAKSLTDLKKGRPLEAYRSLGLSTTKALERRRVSRVDQLLNKKGVANAWLEMSYGWIPLLSDAHDGAQSLAHQLSVPAQQTYRARRHATQGKSGKQRFVFDTAAGPRYVSSGTITSSTELVARVSEVDTVQLSGLLDPAQMAWEILPFSFVADWFIPIQSYLSGRSVARSVHGTFISSHLFQQEASGVSRVGPPLFPGDEIVGNASGAYMRVVHLSRTVSTSLSVPMPKIKPLGSVPSWRRAINAVSLLIQRHGS